MKKIMSFAAAMLTAAAAMPCIPKADIELNVKNKPHLTYLHSLEVEQKTVRYITEKNLDIDFNSDGKFDHLDCYLLDRYNDYPGSHDYLPEDIRTKIAANADLDGNGKVDEKLEIICHFLLYCDIDTSYFAQSTYEAYDDELGIRHGPSYNSNNFSINFIDTLNNRTIYLGVHYLFLQKMIEEGKVDPDVNNDGKFDISDVLDFEIATTSEPWIGIQDPDTGIWSYKCSPDKKIELDDEIKARAKAITLEQSNYGFIQDYDTSALLDCLFMTEPVLPEYSDNTYYEKFHEGAQYYYIGDYVKAYLEYSKDESISVPSLDEIEKQASEKEKLQKQFFDDIESGKIPAPDLNFDNKIDGRDLHIADLFHGDRLYGRTAEESKLTKEEYDNLDQNCDYNNNGISGDDDDLELISTYILNSVIERTNAMATDSTGEFYKEYADALFAKEMDPDNNIDVFAPFRLYDDKYENFVFPTLEDHYKNYLAGVASKMKSAPDIDGNGTVDELDKMYAESYVTYLQTGKMGDTEIPDDVLERIKNECDFTSDGNSGLLYDMQVAALYIDRVVLKKSDQGTEETSSQPDPELTEKLSGDTNCDGEINMADAVLIMQALANPNKYGINGTDENHLTEQGKLNGDMNGDGLTVGDAQAIQYKLLGIKEEKSEVKHELSDIVSIKTRYNPVMSDWSGLGILLEIDPPGYPVTLTANAGHFADCYLNSDSEAVIVSGNTCDIKNCGYVLWSPDDQCYQNDCYIEILVEGTEGDKRIQLGKIYIYETAGLGFSATLEKGAL